MASKPHRLKWLEILLPAMAILIPQPAFCATEEAKPEDTSVSVIKSLVEDAQLALYCRAHDEAIPLLRKTIDLNPHDAGASYDPTQFRRDITSDYGRSQIHQMLVDRPLMATYIDEEDDLYKWAAWRFDAQINGGGMKWNPAPTDHPLCNSQVHIPHPNDPGFIKIRNLPTSSTNKEAVFEWLWSCAAFELHNVDNAANFDALYEKARQNKITEDDFVKEMFFLEYRAEQRNRKWYVEIYLPHAKKHNLRCQPMFWHFDTWGEPESTFKAFTDKTTYPWLPYISFYKGLHSNP